MSGLRAGHPVVLSGGGARAAYQVGVLQAIQRALPNNTLTISVICGYPRGRNQCAGPGKCDRLHYAVQRHAACGPTSAAIRSIGRLAG